MIDEMLEAGGDDDIESENQDINLPQVLPLVPLRDVVVFRGMAAPLFVGRENSVMALKRAMDNDTKNKYVILVAQKDSNIDAPQQDDLYDIGTIAHIVQLLKLPDGTVKVLVEGYQYAKISKWHGDDGFYDVEYKILQDEEVVQREVELLARSLLSQFDKFVKLNKKIPSELVTMLSNMSDANRLADTIVAHLGIRLEEKQQFIEELDLTVRLERLVALIEAEIDLLNLEKRISGRVKRQIEKNQREFYLKEQMSAIQQELGKLDNVVDDSEMLLEKINKAGMPKEAKEKSDSELSKMRMMSPMSAEATVCRNYIDVMLSLPWKKKSRLRHDLPEASELLDNDHYGLEKVKERILEYLAVQQRVEKQRGAILCLVGPPGVGKTSLGESISRATNRKFARIALGGVRDEAEIRGHRRTYIGSMPGKILQKMSKVAVRNPLILLDEVDKMASDFRGDPASALLEVLDPEQNHVFNDHYLEVDYDLSDVMFVCTANEANNIPVPLLDRMEVIQLSGYTESEKLHIAENYLLPKQKKLNGVREDEMHVTKTAIVDIIRYYTREAGVRGLEREISKLSRKVVKRTLLKGDDAPKKKKTSRSKATAKSSVKTNKKVLQEITAKKLDDYLGVKKYRFGQVEDDASVGQVVGLAWTQVGGELLNIEATIVPGKGKVQQTGQLGDVMKESVQAAYSVVRSRAQSLGITGKFYETQDLHIHLPEGAIPKDGPSAGIGLTTAMISALSGIAVKPDVAMTGEITLRGSVLPIGGLKEKLLAAVRGGITTVIIPHDNERDLKDIPREVLEVLNIITVKWIDEVINIALCKIPVPKKRATKTKVAGKSVKATKGALKDKELGNDGKTLPH